MPKRPTDNIDDGELFRQATSGVQPLKGKRRIRTQQIAPEPRPKMQEQDAFQVMQELADLPDNIEPDSGESMNWRGSLSLKQFRKLQRGELRCDAELDLHHHTVAEARAAVAGFLLHCKKNDWRCIRFIHGKGLRSGPRGPRIRHALEGWLRHRREVIAFATPPQWAGGSGAVMVLLRRADR